MSHIGLRLNERFLASYISLDKNCCEKFGIANGGVTEYINRLNNTRFAPGREEALPRLVRYRNIRNKMAHEIGSLRRMSEITKLDLKWIRTFDKDITKGRDPISKYLKRARRYARRRKIERFVTVFAIILALAIGVITYVLLR
ncbi:MAG: hypothetical protein E7612_03660 [Ruminococcaceae bacterium]|nr:hypothetical protein [Oscillospiraceae bacterium]